MHIAIYHWASPPPYQGAASQNLSRWVCWPSHHKPWLNTREFTGTHRTGDDKRLGLGDGKRDLYILFSPHGAVFATTAPQLPMHQAKKQQHRPRCHIQTHHFLVVIYSAPGLGKKLVMQYHTEPAPCGQMSGNTDHSDGWITIRGTDRIPVINKALCENERNLCH